MRKACVEENIQARLSIRERGTRSMYACLDAGYVVVTVVSAVNHIQLTATRLFIYSLLN